MKLQLKTEKKALSMNSQMIHRVAVGYCKRCSHVTCTCKKCGNLCYFCMFKIPVRVYRGK